MPRLPLGRACHGGYIVRRPREQLRPADLCHGLTPCSQLSAGKSPGPPLIAHTTSNLQARTSPEIYGAGEPASKPTVRVQVAYFLVAGHLEGLTRSCWLTGSFVQCDSCGFTCKAEAPSALLIPSTRGRPRNATAGERHGTKAAGPARLRPRKVLT